MSENNVPQTLLNANDLVCGYVSKEGVTEEYLLHGTLHDMAHFIGHHMDCDQIIITDRQDRLILSTIGFFLDKVADQSTVFELQDHLIPLQMAEKEPDDIEFCSQYDFENQYLKIDATLSPELLSQPERLAYAMIYGQTESGILFFEKTPENAANIYVELNNPLYGDWCDIYTFDGDMLLDHFQKREENAEYRSAVRSLQEAVNNGKQNTVVVPCINADELRKHDQELWLRQRRGRCQTIDDYCIYKATWNQELYHMVMAEQPDEAKILQNLQADYNEQMPEYPERPELYNDDKGFHLDRCIEELQLLEKEYITDGQAPEL